MEDSPEDLPKQPPRRTAARPFFSPRPEGTANPNLVIDVALPALDCQTIHTTP